MISDSVTTGTCVLSSLPKILYIMPGFISNLESRRWSILLVHLLNNTQLNSCSSSAMELPWQREKTANCKAGRSSSSPETHPWRSVKFACERQERCTFTRPMRWMVLEEQTGPQPS